MIYELLRKSNGFLDFETHFYGIYPTNLKSKINLYNRDTCITKADLRLV